MTEEALQSDDGAATVVAYSSFGRLSQLPVDVLKLDRVFVQPIDVDNRKRALAASILHLAETMALGMIAEGVETEAEARVLRASGYRLAQGFLFARPMPADEFARLAGF